MIVNKIILGIPDQYIRKQDGIILSGFQMVGQSGIQMEFENQTIWHLTYFWLFEYRTSLVFRSTLYYRIVVKSTAEDDNATFSR